MADGSTADGGLRAVFLAQRAMLLRLFVARLGSREEAEDALHDLWLRLDQIGTTPIAQPAAFLFRVASNLATDRRIAGARRDARAPTVASRLWLRLEAMTGGITRARDYRRWAAAGSIVASSA